MCTPPPLSRGVYSRGMATRTEALDHIATSIAGPSNETAPDDFNTDAIADDLYAAAGGTWDISHLDHDVFWQSVERHAKEQA